MFHPWGAHLSPRHRRRLAADGAEIAPNLIPMHSSPAGSAASAGLALKTHLERLPHPGSTSPVGAAEQIGVCPGAREGWQGCALGSLSLTRQPAETDSCQPGEPPNTIRRHHAQDPNRSEKIDQHIYARGSHPGRELISRRPRVGEARCAPPTLVLVWIGWPLGSPRVGLQRGRSSMRPS